MCEDDVYVYTHTHSLSLPPLSLSPSLSPFIVPFFSAIVSNSVIMHLLISFVVTADLIMKLKSVFIERGKG